MHIVERAASGLCWTGRTVPGHTSKRMPESRRQDAFKQRQGPGTLICSQFCVSLGTTQCIGFQVIGIPRSSGLLPPRFIQSASIHGIEPSSSTSCMTIAFAALLSPVTGKAMRCGVPAGRNSAGAAHIDVVEGFDHRTVAEMLQATRFLTSAEVASRAQCAQQKNWLWTSTPCPITCTDNAGK
jgi:hypothetical protein